MAKDVGVFMCGAPASLVNQVGSGRRISVSNLPVTRVYGYRKWRGFQGGCFQ